MEMGKRAAVVIVATAIAVMSVGCDDNRSNCNDQNPCDERGYPLIWMPYIVPAYGIYGQPGYRPPQTVQPGTPGYRPTFQGKPPNYNPPKSVQAPKPGGVPKAPAPKMPASKPYSPPKIK